jgi:amino acid transporter
MCLILALRSDNGLDVYGWMGSLATYGFIVAYGLVSIALPRYLREHGVFHPAARAIPSLAFVAMLLALAGNPYPVPEGRMGNYLIFISGIWRQGCFGSSYVGVVER